MIPPLDIQQVFVAPWTTDLALYGWIVLMGFLVTASCGLVGNYLILRKMSLMGDAISHSVLPGIVIAFLISGQRDSLVMMLGAMAAGVLATVFIEFIHQRSRLKEDAAIGIAFSCFFALGVLLISQYASQVDLDADCVLYGEINFVPLFPPMELFGLSLGPRPVAFMGFVFLGVTALVILFYHELLISSFDAGLAGSLGLNSRVIHYALMCLLSVVVVSSFEAVGAILVIAMLILPGASAYLLSKRLPGMMGWTLVSSALSSVFGMHAGIWLNCSTASAMVLVSALLFVLVWMVNPAQGLLWQGLRRFRSPASESPEPDYM